MSLRGRYLGVGVGRNCSFNLQRESMDYFSVKVMTQHLHHIFTHSERLVLLPALTLAVLDEGHLNELVSHEGGSHQLRTDHEKITINCNHSLFLHHAQVCTEAGRTGVCD